MSSSQPPQHKGDPGVVLGETWRWTGCPPFSEDSEGPEELLRDALRSDVCRES